MASSENASAACAETSTEVSELVSDSADEDADMQMRVTRNVIFSVCMWLV